MFVPWLVVELASESKRNGRAYHNIVSLYLICKMRLSQLINDQRRHFSPIITHVVLSFSLLMIELNLNMGLAPLGLPMVTLLLVPSTTSRVVSTYL